MTTQLSFGYLQQQQAATMPRRRVCDLPVEERPLYRLHHAGCMVQDIEGLGAEGAGAVPRRHR